MPSRGTAGPLEHGGFTRRLKPSPPQTLPCLIAVPEDFGNTHSPFSAGRPARGPCSPWAPLLSSPPRPRSTFCHCQLLSLLSPHPSPRLCCRCFQPPGGLGNSPFLHLQKMHFATYFSLLCLGDSSEDRRTRWLSQPLGICGSGSRPAVDILPGCDGGDSPLPFLPPPSPELWPYCYVFEADTAGAPFMSRSFTPLLCVSGFGAVSSIFIVLSSVPLLQQEGEEKQPVLCPQTTLVFSCECRIWAQRKTQALHFCRSPWSDSQVWAPPAQPITNAEAALAVSLADPGSTARPSRDGGQCMRSSPSLTTSR